MKDTALVIVDVQEKLLSVMKNSESLVKNISKLAEAAKILSLPVLWCQQYPKALGNTPSEITDFLDVPSIDKMSFSCCANEEFKEELAKLSVKRVIICGIESHICVFQTARDLLRKGYEVEVVADAVSSRTDENKQIAIRRLCQSGAQISSVEMTLFDLVGTAEDPCFKQISKLVK